MVSKAVAISPRRAVVVAVAGILGVRAKSLNGSKRSAIRNAVTFELGDRTFRCAPAPLEKVRGRG